MKSRNLKTWVIWLVLCALGFAAGYYGVVYFRNKRNAPIQQENAPGLPQ